MPAMPNFNYDKWMEGWKRYSETIAQAQKKKDNREWQTTFDEIMALDETTDCPSIELI